MQTMRARGEEQGQENNAFKALEVVSTTSSDNYKDDTTYEEYKAGHLNVLEQERNFLKTLICFQTVEL